MSARSDIMAFIGANARGFHEAMQRVRGDAKKTAKDTRNDFAYLSAGLTRSFALLKASLAGLGVGVSLTGMVAGAAQVAQSVTEAGDAARRAGMDFRSFQQLAYVARVNRIEVDKLTDGVKELQLRGSEFFTTGSGSAAEAFKALGYSAAQVREQLKKPSEFLTEIIGKLGQLDRASQINFADKLFGGSAAEEFVRLIDQGADALRRTVKEAEAVGAVLSDDVLAKANELDRLIRTAGDTVGNHLKAAIIEAAWELARFIDSWRAFDNQRSSTLTSRITEIDQERRELENQLLALKADQDNIAKWASDLGVGAKTDGSGFAKAIQERIIALTKEGAEIEAILAKRRELEKPTTPPPALPTLPPPEDKTRSAAAAAIERQRKAVDDLISSLQMELSLVGSSNFERDIATTLRRLNVDAMSAEGQKIADLIRQIDAETEAVNRAKQAKEGLAQAGEYAFGMIGDALTSIAGGSTKAEDAVKRLAVQLALAAAQAALLGTGPLAALFGGGGGTFGLFPGGWGFSTPGIGLYADGGVAAYGRRQHMKTFSGGGISDTAAIFGEAGPEAAVPLPDGRRIPVELRMPSLTNMLAQGGRESGTVNINIDVTGARGNTEIMEMVQSGVQAGLKEYDKGNLARVVSGYTEGRKRGKIR